MEVSAHAAHAFPAKGEGEYWSSECLATLEVIFRCFLVDTCEEEMALVVVSVYAELVVAGVADGSSDDVAIVLTSLAVEREHHFAV